MAAKPGPKRPTTGRPGAHGGNRSQPACSVCKGYLRKSDGGCTACENAARRLVAGKAGPDAGAAGVPRRPAGVPLAFAVPSSVDVNDRIAQNHAALRALLAPPEGFAPVRAAAAPGPATTSAPLFASSPPPAVVSVPLGLRQPSAPYSAVESSLPRYAGMTPVIVTPRPAPSAKPTTFDAALAEIDAFEAAVSRPGANPALGQGGREVSFDSAAAAQHLRKVATLVSLPQQHDNDPVAAREVYSAEVREQASRFAAVTVVASDPSDPSRAHPAYREFLARVRQEQAGHAVLREMRDGAVALAV